MKRSNVEYFSPKFEEDIFCQEAFNELRENKNVVVTSARGRENNRNEQEPMDK